MTLLTRWEPVREFSGLQDRLNRMNRLFRESFSVKCRELRQAFAFKLGKYIEAGSAAYYRVSTELAAHKNVDMERARNDLEEHQLVCASVGNSYQNLKSDLRPHIHG